ncbi:MAG: RelA/SpoT family protein [Bacteroidales bacterium]|nr:RelA/SpoT family protein [Bacteroidales bacterium]
MLSEKEHLNIRSRYVYLLRNCKTVLRKGDTNILRAAYELAFLSYKNKRRQSGEVYLIHPIEVAIIVASEIGLGTDSVVCALIHNVLVDKKITLEEVRESFGDNVAVLLEGFTTLTGLKTDRTSFQSENFIKLLLTIAKDVRVILIKIADRLHNMRNISAISLEDQKKIASETSLLYSPIAHRLGLYNIKNELDDLSMKFLELKTYRVIEKKLQDTESERMKLIAEFINSMNKEMKRQKFNYQIKSRLKSISSIWNKMKTQNLDFEEVYDIFAVRIILNSEIAFEKSDCWRVYSIVTDIYKPNPKRLRDWISTPKASGYESLHTTVLGPGNKWVEVQIRTKRMDTIAEKGDAAHWLYKESSNEKDSSKWLRTIRTVIETTSPEKIVKLDKSKLELYSDKIFVYTPRGDLKKLKKGATVLDFAYEIHTSIGNKCTGARLNDKIVPIKHALQNGDRLEIITSNSQKPKSDWLNYTVTEKARTRIKRSLQDESTGETETGKDILKRKFRNWKVKFNEESVDKILKHFKLKNSIVFYHLIANEKIDLQEIKKILSPSYAEVKEKSTVPQTDTKDIADENVKEDVVIIDKSLNKVDYKFAKCCNPIYGDKVFGFITIGKGVTIHRVTCPNVQQMAKNYKYRFINVEWKKSQKDELYIANIKISGKDRLGIVNSISDVVSSDLKVNMRSISVNSRGDMFDGVIKVSIKSTKHLDTLLRKLQKIKGVLQAYRVESVGSEQ